MLWDLEDLLSKVSGVDDYVIRVYNDRSVPHYYSCTMKIGDKLKWFSIYHNDLSEFLLENGFMRTSLMDNRIIRSSDVHKDVALANFSIVNAHILENIVPGEFHLKIGENSYEDENGIVIHCEISYTVFEGDRKEEKFKIYEPHLREFLSNKFIKIPDDIIGAEVLHKK